eukprot:43412_1
MINNILYLALSSFVAFSSGELFEYTEFQSSDAGKDISFGSSASISNDYFAVGAYKESTDGTNTGAAYIFQKDNSIGWNQIQKIQASDKKAADQFGVTIDISGNYLAVGTNVDTVYMFEENGFGAWNQVQKIQIPGTIGTFNFGRFALSISGDYLAVGAPSTNNGVVYLYKKDIISSVWHLIQTIEPSDGAFNDWFGRTLSLSGNYLAIGSGQQPTGSTFNTAGSLYIYELDNSGIFNEIQKIQSTENNNNYVGFSVSISSDYLLLGAKGENARKGVAHLYQRDVNNNIWNKIQQIQPADQNSVSLFAHNVRVSDDQLIIAAIGSIYIFERDNFGVFNEIENIKPPNTDSTFGSSLDISNGNTIVSMVAQEKVFIISPISTGLCCECSGAACGQDTECANTLCLIGYLGLTPYNPDPYCCSTAWDGICENEAQFICNAESGNRRRMMNGNIYNLRLAQSTLILGGILFSLIAICAVALLYYSCKHQANNNLKIDLIHSQSDANIMVV